MAAPKTFFAYPSEPNELRQTIERGHAGLNRGPRSTIWPQLPIFGGHIPNEVLTAIKEATYSYFDVTIPNPNVYYELGYAIGRGKAVGPVVNTSFDGAGKRIQQQGIFDNIGYKSYVNSTELTRILRIDPKRIMTDLYYKEINLSQPLYLLDTLKKTDFRNSIVSAIKSSEIFYRSFDPVETPRLSTPALVSEISSSSGVVIPLLPTYTADSELHNLRAAFIAGLSHGLGRQTLLIKMFEEHVPLPADFRDEIVHVRSFEEVTAIVESFATKSLLNIQTASRNDRTPSHSLLRNLTLGSTAAENEFRTLGNYFLETNSFSRTVRGDVRVVTGRKGAGKSAIFFRTRDALRNKKTNIVIDLKPESYQLVEFRANLAEIDDIGVFSHTISAFWYFVILSEIIVHIRRMEEKRAKYNEESLVIAQRAENLINEHKVFENGDFTNRLNSLARHFAQEMRSADGRSTVEKIRGLTNVIFRDAIPALRDFIVQYSSMDTTVVLLFDNLDKGWPTAGVEKLDVRLARHLLEALDKISNDFAARDRQFWSTVFLRNDVFELLMDDMPDRGKTQRVNVDWTDREALKQLILKRLQASEGGAGLDFDSLWNSRFTKEVNGQDSFDYFVDHCVMRPRFLIALIEAAVANALNRGHAKVSEHDCVEAVKQNAFSLIDDFGFEIRDVSQSRYDILYDLAGLDIVNKSGAIVDRLVASGLEREAAENVFQLMLWYGVIGIRRHDGSDMFIYDVQYKMNRLQAEMRASDFDDIYVFNAAIYPALS